MNQNNETQIKRTKDPEEIELESPILIEGLPGVGMVGKMSADQIKDQLKTEKYADIYSKNFNPLVDIKEDYTINLRKNQLHIHERKEGEKDLVLLTGQEQGVTPQGQYSISKEVIDEAEKLGIKEIYTLGGYATKTMKEKPKIFGAVTHPEMKEKYEKQGVKFEKRGPIGGAAGLLLGFGREKDMKGICLMGETHGKLPDPNAAKKILSLMEKFLDLDLDYSKLDKKAKNVKKSIEKMKKAQKAQQRGMTSSDSPMEYIQ